MGAPRTGILEAWQERGRAAGGRGRSVWVSLSGIAAAAIVIVQLFGAQAITDVVAEGTDAGVRETILLAKREGARPALLDRKMRELAALKVNDARRENLMTAYANALVRARDLAREAGMTYVSDEVIAATADALVAGGTREDVRWILEKAEKGRAASAMSRYYILIRRGERSSAAAAMALRE